MSDKTRKDMPGFEHGGATHITPPQRPSKSAQVFNGKFNKVFSIEADIAKQILALIYSQEGQISLVSALGILKVVESTLLKDHES